MPATNLTVSRDRGDCRMFNDRDVQELDTFYRAHHRAILREALRLTGCQDEAWDLVQDTFERAFGAYTSFRPGTSGFRWLCTIMTRLFIDRWRRRRNRGPFASLDDIDIAAPMPEDQPLWSTFSREDLQAVLTELPPKTRALVEQHAFEAVPYATLAGRFHMPVATIGTRLFRTRGKLKSALLARQRKQLAPPAAPAATRTEAELTLPRAA